MEKRDVNKNIGYSMETLRFMFYCYIVRIESIPMTLEELL